MKLNYNYVMRKALIAFVMMFGILFAIATAIVWYMGLPLKAGLMAAVITVLFQYFIGPYLVTAIYKIDFDSYMLKAINPEVIEFISKVCSDNSMPVPKLGIIDDGNPNAFCYGHFKRDANLVVTKGLLDVLDVEEQKAVVAHELGHIKNNDFILMAVVSLIPLIMYQIYAWTHNSSKQNLVYWIGLGAYGAYIVSQYVVLSFSRIREFFADNFSKNILKTGEPLKSALIKIAYGFTKNEKCKKLKASAIGIADAAQSESYLLVNYNNKNEDDASYKKLMSWDTKSLWGKWYELNSAHPLTAKRILALSDDNAAISKPGIKQFLNFLLELFVKILPWAMAAYIVIPHITEFNLVTILKLTWAASKNQPAYLLTLGAAILLYYYYSYSRSFENKSIEELLLREDASPIKGIPAVLEGRIIGKGIPGLFWSEDIVLNDGTGIILVDYKQPFKFLEFIFGCLVVNNITDMNAKVIGWYKRSSRPYFACRKIIVDNKKYISFNYILTKLLGYGLILTGLILYALML
ncbi:MAG: zinc metalloprotease HtpX [Bacillota bacterium]|nr:zinc metalloprotease HtpX [Bacillota bacterium]